VKTFLPLLHRQDHLESGGVLAAVVVDVAVVAEEKEDDEQQQVNVSVKEGDCSLILGLR
jgi:hypothetical protein